VSPRRASDYIPATMTMSRILTMSHRELYAPRLAAITSGHIGKDNRSINFLHPYTSAQSIELFTRVAPTLTLTGPGRVVMWVARLPAEAGEEALESRDLDGNETAFPDIVGTVQLAFHVAPNGQFRSEVRKLIVDDRYQGRGIARVLMETLEREAKAGGSTLCVSLQNPTDDFS
jgi:GNAT superfamily N-acetyltransferase